MQHLTELEEKLSQPGGLALQKHMLAALEATALRLRQQLAASVPRAEFEVHKKALDAAQAAIEVLQGWPTNDESRLLETPLSPLPAHAPGLQRQYPGPESSEDAQAPAVGAPASFISPDRTSSLSFLNIPFVNLTRSFS